jgi:hypothetical protein
MSKIYNWLKKRKSIIVIIINVLITIIGGAFAAFIGAFINAYTHYQQEKAKIIPAFKGEIDKSFLEFIDKNIESIFHIDISLNEEQSEEIARWSHENNQEPIIWFGVHHEDSPTEFGFHKEDNEIHWNTRYWDSIKTKGYFKVHSIQGPYQGWWCITLKGVGKEHMKNHA